MKYVYAFVCTTCKHRAVIHGMTKEDSDLYRCRECGCEMPQDGLVYELSRGEWADWVKKYPESSQVRVGP